MKVLPRILLSAVLAAGLLSAPVATGIRDEAVAGPPVRPDVEQRQIDAGPMSRDVPADAAADSDFRLVGLTWAPEDADQAGPVEVRYRSDRGRWSEWQTLDLAENPAEPGTDEAQTSRPATDLLWVDSARAVQVRPMSQRGAGSPRVEMINPGRGQNDDALASGLAGAAHAALPGQPAIVTRSQWGADESLRDCTPSIASTLKAAVVHHTVGSNTYSASDSAAIVRGIYAFHTQSRGWCDIGYNFLVDRFGTIFEGRYGGVDQNVIGAHVGGFNTYTMGVSMMGTFSDVVPPTATTEALASLIAWRLASMYLDPGGSATLTSAGNSKYPAGTVVTIPRIVGHRDLYATECPGDTAYGNLSTLKSRVGAAVGRSIEDSPVYQMWLRSGGPSGPLGEPRVGEKATATGLMTRFNGGAGYYSTATSAHPVVRGMYTRYRQLDETSGPLGYPTTPEYPTTGGAAQNFSNGSMYWSRDLRTTHPVVRGMYTRYRQLDETSGPLGYPTTAEYPTTGGAAQDFHRGRIVWNRSSNTFSVELYDAAIPRPASGSYLVTGRGYGHGIGMSQWGAYQAASTGTKWAAILGSYYPGTTASTTSTGTIRARIEGDTGYDLILRTKTGLRIAWLSPTGSPQESLAPASIDGCAPAWWRVKSTASGLTIDFLCGDVWRVWKTEGQVNEAGAVTFRADDGTVDTAVRGSSGFTRKAYRGALEGRRSASSIIVTNVVPLESYLRSVVPNEVPASWPVEALKAQAVAARTYAMRERLDRSGQSFHVYDSTKSQYYPGLFLYDSSWAIVRRYEDTRTDTAVAGTAGFFMMAEGQPALTQFSSSNGGWTARGGAAYLPLQRDDWDRAATANPYREWTRSVSVTRLEGLYPAIGRLTSLRVLERDGGGEWGGRVTKLGIAGSAGTVTVSGDAAVRAALGVPSSYLGIA
jgi:SpoIID/LytB domain protein